MRRLLCWLGWHRWKYDHTEQMPNGAYVIHEWCKCGAHREELSWNHALESAYFGIDPECVRVLR